MHTLGIFLGLCLFCILLFNLIMDSLPPDHGPDEHEQFR